jgi:hypothetical protein
VVLPWVPLSFSCGGCSLRRNFAANLSALLLAVPSLAAAQDSLCTGNEQMVWSCQAKGKIYSLCASPEISNSTGYLQYRAGSKTRVELNHPTTQRHPRGYFSFQLMPRGVSVTFTNKGYEYVISEPLAGRTSVNVSKGGQSLPPIECKSSSESLTLTTTINQFKAVGLFAQ